MTYCIHCSTELPEGARYCFSCGKAVGRIEQGRKLIGDGQLVPVMKEERGSEREYVRIRDVVSVSDDAAALVVYCHASQQGQTVSRIRTKYYVVPGYYNRSGLVDCRED